MRGAAPALELVAATTVNGNVAVEFCTENTLRVFDHIGVSIPVYEGMSTPLMRADFPVPRSQTKTPLIHGNHLPIPAATSHAREQSAVDFLIEYYLSPGRRRSRCRSDRSATSGRRSSASRAWPSASRRLC